MKNLSLTLLTEVEDQPGLNKPGTNIFSLPEKVLQFGTGVLLRGLPDYFIDKANKQGIFNGRVVVVKSTSQGDTNAFDTQEGLFTQCIRGLEGTVKVEENIINASISRVLSAKEQWDEILQCATNPEMEVVISNTTEVGISLNKEDKIDATPPVSFPGKLLAFLYKRYQSFNGDPSKGMVIIPTELIVDNGAKLESIVLELAHLNNVDPLFMDWLENANHFCSSLVDRIVPGKLPAADQEVFKSQYAYNDDLMIMSESYSLWAIQASSPVVKEKLSFYKADEGVVIAPDINKFRELKLRLLNGTHTYSCGLAHLAGFVTVKEAMENDDYRGYVLQLMLNEIAPAVTSNEITYAEAKAFAEKVVDRFRNPFIEHLWLSISVQYSSKMKMRNVPVLLKHYEDNSSVPELMALGFAAYILFMQCKVVDGKFVGNANGKDYLIQDDHAGWFAERHLQGAGIVEETLSDVAFWDIDLTKLPGFAGAVTEKYNQLARGKVQEVITASLSEKEMASKE